MSKKPPPKKALMPWEKEMIDLTKYDWAIAVGHHPAHKNCPRDLRVANVFQKLTDAETGLMWATQQTIAQLAGLGDERQVRTAMQRFEASKAIEKKRIANLQTDTLEALGAKMNSHRNRRGAVYKLRMFWAYETFETYAKRDRREPEQLRKGRLVKRTTIVRSKRTTIVRSGADHDSPAYIQEDISTDIKEGHEGGNPIKVSSVEVSSEADTENWVDFDKNGVDPNVPFPVPETEAVQMLTVIFDGRDLGPGYFAYFRKRLFDGLLTPADVENHWRSLA
jgi:hypothetical protein